MELSGFKTYVIKWKYSIPFKGGAEGIWWNFHSIPFQKMEWNKPLVNSGVDTREIISRVKPDLLSRLKSVAAGAA